MTKHLFHRFILFIGIFTIWNTSYSQQRFLNNQRSWNDMMFNPAKIMETHGISIYTIHRQQYLGLGSNSPYITIIGGKANLPVHYSFNMLNSELKKRRNYNYAVGGYYIHSNTGGIYDQNEICGQFGIQFKLNQSSIYPEIFKQFNFGISVKGINNRYRGNGIDLYDQYDPIFNSLQATNKFALSITPGFQFVTRKINMDAFFTLGPKDQQFGSITFSGSNLLDNFMNQFALRVNYLGSQNLQLSINKIHEFRSSNRQTWALNCGVNIFAGTKFTSTSSFLNNPGIYVGVIYRVYSEAKKITKPYRIPMKYNAFSGSLNLFDTNLNTFAMGPSSEIGLQYSRNVSVCECDRIYDEFLLNTRKKQDLSSLENLKRLESEFKSSCIVESYKISYESNLSFIKDKIKEIEEEVIQEKPFSPPSCTINNQEWNCDNLSYFGSNGIRLIKNQAEWDTTSLNAPCCCYVNFDEANKDKGLLYNSKAFRILLSDLEIRNSGFRVATKKDWELLFESAKKYGNTEKLYNCDGKNPNGFNLKSIDYAYLDGDWVPDFSAYWVGEQDVYIIDCSAKGELLPISSEDIDDAQLKIMLASSAFMVRLIKK